jgi:hypothetical protein
MSGWSTARLLDVWERADGLAPIDRAVSLASAVEPEEDPGEVAALPLGRRDARILRLREELVTGATMHAMAACPLMPRAGRVAADLAALRGPTEQAPPGGTLEVDGFVVKWRPPDGRDLAAAAAAGDAEAADRVPGGALHHPIGRSRRPGGGGGGSGRPRSGDRRDGGGGPPGGGARRHRLPCLWHELRGRPRCRGVRLVGDDRLGTPRAAMSPGPPAGSSSRPRRAR